jgi:putative transposase
MKTWRLTYSQIIAILRLAETEAGSALPELCPEHGISSAALY